jgi:hypothetical protein
MTWSLFVKARVSPWDAEVGFEPSAELLRRRRSRRWTPCDLRLWFTDGDRS